LETILVLEEAGQHPLDGTVGYHPARARLPRARAQVPHQQVGTEDHDRGRIVPSGESLEPD
jgi:hypothetical protein